MLNLLSTTLRKVCLFVLIVLVWTAQSITPDSVIKTAPPQRWADTLAASWSRPWLEAYRQWCNQNAHEGYPSSQWDALALVRPVSLARPAQTRWYPSLENQSHAKIWSNYYDQIRSHQALDLILATENLVMTEFRCHSRPRGSVTRTRKGNGRWFEVVDFPSFSWTDEIAMTL